MKAILEEISSDSEDLETINKTAKTERIIRPM